MDHKLNIEDLQESLQTSFICKKHDSSEKYRSKFLINSGQFSAGNIQKVICDILDELRGCESFDISVAFITDGGVNLLTQTLLELKPEFGRFRQTKSSQLFDYQRVQSFFKLLSCVHARACP